MILVIKQNRHKDFRWFVYFKFACSCLYRIYSIIAMASCGLCCYSIRLIFLRHYKHLQLSIYNALARDPLMILFQTWQQTDDENEESDTPFRQITEMTILTVQLIVEFAKGLPGFAKISQPDQITLLKVMITINYYILLSSNQNLLLTKCFMKISNLLIVLGLNTTTTTTCFSTLFGLQKYFSEEIYIRIIFISSNIILSGHIACRPILQVTL